MADIQTKMEDVMRKPSTAYSTAKEVKVLVEKWNRDFGDCDPAWAPPKANADTENVHRDAVALGAFIQS